MDDLRVGAFEGVEPWAERIELFRRSTELIDPVVRRVLEDTDRAFLEGTGEIEHGPAVEEAGGAAEARWELHWPEQRRARNVRAGGSVDPIQVVAFFAAGFTHPHLRGSRAGDWPLQVTTGEDATRQEPIVRAIVEAELHQRIFEGTWRIIPGYGRGR